MMICCSGCLSTKMPAVSKPVPPAVFIDYHRTGGIAGTDDRVVIFDNGVAVISSRQVKTEIALNASDLDRITAMLVQAQFPILQENYPAPRGSADLMNYTISYHSKTVTVQDTAIPPGIQPVIDEMNQILIDASTQNQERSKIHLTA